MLESYAFGMILPYNMSLMVTNISPVFLIVVCGTEIGPAVLRDIILCDIQIRE